ncbi:MAG: lysophospholipid acyltransferase family protein [Chthoniobacterales bacterium]
MRASGTLPEISRPLLRFFGAYATNYLGRHFHAVRVLGTARAPNELGKPLVIFLNHAAWWDPLVCLFLARRFFPNRRAYGPIEATALERYRFFKRLGIFPVESGTTRGAAQFLRASRAILERPESALFLTPQGKFADVRTPLALAPGIEHLAAHAPEALFVPLAIEYPFWEERQPEVLLAFGRARPGGDGDSLTQRLAATQLMLAGAAQCRLPNEWQVLHRGKGGVSVPYDLSRRIRARLRGEAFHLDHSSL